MTDDDRQYLEANGWKPWEGLQFHWRDPITGGKECDPNAVEVQRARDEHTRRAGYNEAEWRDHFRQLRNDVARMVGVNSDTTDLLARLRVRLDEGASLGVQVAVLREVLGRARRFVERRTECACIGEVRLCSFHEEWYRIVGDVLEALAATADVGAAWTALLATVDRLLARWEHADDEEMGEIERELRAAAARVKGGRA